MLGETWTIPYYAVGASGELKFQEDSHTYLGDPSGTTARYGEDATLAGITYAGSNHLIRPSAGDVDQWEMKYLYTNGGSNPNGEYINGGRYETQQGIATPLIGFALAARLLESSAGMKTAWGHEPFFDYTDRWVSTIVGNLAAVYPYSTVQLTSDFYTDIYKHGGDGAKFMKRMWETYR
jgi:hypothetical protein